MHHAIAVSSRIHRHAHGAALQQAGIFGSVAGVLGTMQATEALKELLGLGQSYRDSSFYTMMNWIRSLKVRRDPVCALCGDNPTIRDLAVAAEYLEHRLHDPIWRRVTVGEGLMLTITFHHIDASFEGRRAHMRQ